MEKKVYFENSGGDKLCGILSDPKSDKERPIVILCHGLGSGKRSSTNMGLEKDLNSAGISTFRFDFHGHGESEGNFEDVTISRAIDDILKAIEFLKQLGYTRIGLAGSSFGGGACLIAASKTKEIVVLALKCPVSNYEEKTVKMRVLSEQELKDWKENGFRMYEMWDGEKKRLNYSFFEDSLKNDGYEAAKQVKVPTIIVHGSEDKTVPVEQSKKTSTLVENCRLEVIEGADHGFSNQEHFNKTNRLMAEFLIEKLLD